MPRRRSQTGRERGAARRGFRPAPSSPRTTRGAQPVLGDRCLMSPKRVSLVALLAGGHGGVPRYARSLVGALAGVADEFAELELSVLTTERGAELLGILPIEVSAIPLRSPSFNRGAVRIVAE